MRQIDTWARDDEFDRSCRRLVFYTALAVYLAADLDEVLPRQVLVSKIYRKAPRFWEKEVLEKMADASPEECRAAVAACERALPKS